MEFVVKNIKGKDLLELKSAKSNEIKYLKLYFKRRVDKWQFKKKEGSAWDGYINFFFGYRWLPFGLWKELVEYSSEAEIPLEIDGLMSKFDVSIDRNKFKEFCLNLFKSHPEITPRNYQIETAYKILRWRKSSAELATGAGKSLIIYLVCAYLKLIKNKCKVLLIVPNVTLVEQMVDDFKEYDYDEKVNFNFRTVFSGKKIKSDNPEITISTFHSAVKKDEDFFKSFNVGILDEAHKISAASVRKVLDYWGEYDIVSGLTGTMPNKSDASYFTLQQYTGPVIKKISARELMDAGYITPCKVKIIKMNWVSDSIREKLYKHFIKGSEERKGLLNIEKSLIVQSEKRLNKIVDIITKFNTNRLVLFQNIKDGYGKKIVDKLKSLVNCNVYYIDGKVKKEDRIEILKKMKKGGDDILVASYQTLGTGVSIKPIEHIFFTESYKSKDIIRQSIGRGVRQFKNKKMVYIIDFVDDFSYNGESLKQMTPWENYHLKHHLERISIYEDQEFPYSIFETTF